MGDYLGPADAAEAALANGASFQAATGTAGDAAAAAELVFVDMEAINEDDPPAFLAVCYPYLHEEVDDGVAGDDFLATYHRQVRLIYRKRVDAYGKAALRTFETQVTAINGELKAALVQHNIGIARWVMDTQLSYRIAPGFPRAYVFAFIVHLQD